MATSCSLDNVLPNRRAQAQFNGYAEAHFGYHAHGVYLVLSASGPKRPVRVDWLQDLLDTSEARVDVSLAARGSYLEFSSPHVLPDDESIRGCTGNAQLRAVFIYLRKRLSSGFRSEVS
jgi:hypothetical protein